MSAPRPEASVLITTRRDHVPLHRCLRALDAQAYDPAAFEVVVVVLEGNGEAARLLDTMQTKFALRVVRPQGAEGPLTAGVQASEGRICIVLADDVVATPELFGAHLAGHATGERLVGIGRVTEELPRGRDWYARAAAAAWNRRFDSSTVEPRVGWRDLDSGNFSLARGALGEAAGALPALPPGQAALAELAIRLEASGCSVRYFPDAHGVRRRDEPGRRLLAERADEGAARAELASRHRFAGPGILGSFTDGSPRELVLRRSLLRLRVSPAMLAALGRLVPGVEGKQLWFIFVSNYAYWHAVRKRLSPDDWRRIARGVPVLLYHAFGERDESSRFVVSRRMFARQMRLLSLLRFNVLSYDEFARSMREGRPPPRTVVLTIDDGYADNGDIATQILERYGFGATIFLVSGRLGAVNDWSDAAPLRGRLLLSVDQVDPLRERGIEFGAHTRTHCSLPEAADETVAEEVESSRAQLEQILGTPVRTFAYPYGRVDDRVLAAVEHAGFASACTTEPRLAGLDDHPLLMPRIEIKRQDSLSGFLRKVWFGGA